MTTWLRSATGEPRYLGWGRRPQQLYTSLDYMIGLRGVAERQLMRLMPTPFLRATRPLAAQARLALAETQSLPQSSVRGLLLWTGYYKNTWFVGPVEDSNGIRVFAKVFKCAEDSSSELRRSRIVGDLAASAGTFNAIPAARLGCTVVGYDVVHRARLATRGETLEVAAAFGRTSADSALVPAGDDWASRCRSAALILEATIGWPADEAIRLLTRCSPTHLAIAHGDMTPWNLLETFEGPPHLIDYECVGWRPPFYDLVYADSHPLALAGAVSELEATKARLRQLGYASLDIRTMVASALATSILEAADALAEHPDNRSRLSVLAACKLKGLAAISG